MPTRVGRVIGRIFLPPVLLLTSIVMLHAQTNIWTAGTGGKWETGTNWSLGAPGLLDALDNITNAGTKTIIIDAATVSNFSDTLTVSNLTIGAPSNSVNTLLLTNAGTNTPLHVIDFLTLLPGGIIDIENSALTVDNGVQPITLPNGSGVSFDAPVVVNNSVLNTSNALGTTVGYSLYDPEPVTLNMTNSTFTPYDFIVSAFSDASANFVNSLVHSDGPIAVGHDAGFTGNLLVMGGQLIATNTIFSPDDVTATVGSRGAGYATFTNATIQFGDTVIGSIGGASGTITLQSGNLTMRKLFVAESVEQPNTYLVTGSFFQSNGTVNTMETHIGIYTNCTGTVTLSGGTFTSPLVSIGETGAATGSLNLNGGAAFINTLLNVGSNNPLASVSVNAGSLYVTNSAATATTILNGGSLFHGAGIFKTDNLILTNGGELVTVSNFLVGQTNGVTNIASISDGSTITVSNAVFGVGNNGTTNSGSGSGSVTVTNATLNATSLSLGSTAGGSGSLAVQSNGTVNVSSNLIVVGTSLSTTSSIVVAGGNLNVTNGSLLLGTAGTGLMTVSNGSTVTAQTIKLGSAAPGASGTLLMNGGTLRITKLLSVNSTNSIDLKFSGYDVILDGTGASLNIGDDSPGAVNADSTGYANFESVNVGTTNNGTYEQSGMQVFVSDQMIVGSNCLANGAVGTVTMSGGQLYVTNASGTAALVVINGTFVLGPGATLVADNLIITNSCARFQNNGGTLLVNPANIQLDPNLDADGDGVSNGAELAAGTDPLNPASYFHILNATKQGSDAMISWVGAPNRNFYVQACTSAARVTSGNFVNVGPPISGTSTGTNTFTVHGGATGPAVFYRITLAQ